MMPIARSWIGQLEISTIRNAGPNYSEYELRDWLSKAAMGLRTMWNELLGISVVTPGHCLWASTDKQSSLAYLHDGVKWNPAPPHKLLTTNRVMEVRNIHACTSACVYIEVHDKYVYTVLQAMKQILYALCHFYC
jgi:hypothetical protein